MTSPPGSPAGGQVRPMSAMIAPNRSSSRMSVSSRNGGRSGSRASDEDGKTAVRVAVRVRPPLGATDPGYDLVPQRFRGSRCQVTSQTSLAVESAQGKKLFVFDRVFGEEVDQEGVWEYLSDSVNSFVQGYNVSILAYGQSGAGKSYTMGTTGPREQGDPALMGVVPRAAALLFEKLTGTTSNRLSGLRTPSRFSMNSTGLQSSSKPANRNWQMKATYVEIYNEQLRDLLVEEDDSFGERAQVTIREDTKGRILLQGLRQVTINSVEDLLNALNFGSSIRQTDATAVNAKSSRSHAVFSLNLVQKRAGGATSTKEKRYSVPVEAMSGSEGWVTVDSKLHFVDLAGSERLKNTGAEGQRAKEGISINAGLASLGKVISQLSSRSQGSHVSYRDSKLTRLLQDSLGGNAITYMVACVNPAEFHLSETLNTVQYAQRARNIQSKPQIQQVNDDSDKQAAIDRLRAEVSFLRDQIRLNERSGRRNDAPQEQAERQQERAIELQNHLLDIQENYNALSQRHAKLIAEMAKNKETESIGAQEVSDVIGNSALDRIKRSNSFASQVEQVVLEYEKTIQSLEASLSNTRSSLASSESALMEKETKIAYMETLAQQLQTRIQKAQDREANDETYLRDLETRFAGATTGEEKSHAAIQSLRDELSRARDNEASAEEYISTLEERLAEAEQEHEMMQREIERLEHVIERQRGINKLDNLLYELDHIRQAEPGAPRTNGHSKKSSAVSQRRTDVDGANDEIVDVNGHSATSTETESVLVLSENGGTATPRQENNKLIVTDISSIDPEDMPHSPAQSKFVADKLETVTQELFDLRMEHETAVSDLHELNRKYQIALNTLAEMQDAVEETRRPGTRGSLDPSRPTSPSFLADAGLNGLEEDGQPSSSRTLSSELSLLGESPNTMDPSELETAHHRTISTASTVPREEQLAQEMETLKRLHAEKEENMAELAKNYVQLETTHQDTLDYVEELKTEIQKAQAARPASPTAVLRRKSSQQLVTSDRANRAFTSLEKLAQERFENEPDMLQSFELNLTAARTEMQTRTDRIADLEAEVASVRKEMETKMTIITGLTRERSSLNTSSPLDISVVAQMQDQLLETENQIKILQEGHSSREQELTAQIESLKASLGGATPGLETPSDIPGGFPETPALLSTGMKQLGDQPVDVASPQQEVSQWKIKHESSVASMKASEERLLATIHSLETSLRDAETALTANKASSAERDTNITTQSQQHKALVEDLQREIDEHKATAAANAARLVELEQFQQNILARIEADTEARELTEKELQTHRELVANLETQLEQHKSAMSLHQQGLASLQESHGREIAELNEALLAAKAESNEKLRTAHEAHELATGSLKHQLTRAQQEQEEATARLQSELSNAQHHLDELLSGVSRALGKETNASDLESHIQALANERNELLVLHDQAILELETVKHEHDTVKSRASGLEDTVAELKLINEETMKEMLALIEKEKKSSRLVDELEQQLSLNYDQHQAANNRLSALQSERQVEIDHALQAKVDIERELEDSKARITQLEAQLDSTRRNSHRESLDPRDGVQRSNSNSGGPTLRSSASHNSLPSPPPAIPLPPLPGAQPSVNAPSPPTSRHQSKDLAQAQLVEDQEARIRTIEKHLFAEKQLTATLEEALTDLETSSTKMKADVEAWRRKCATLEEENINLKKQGNQSRYSLQQVEEERAARMKLEADRANLEARMAQLSQATKKKKKSALNCF